MDNVLEALTEAEYLMSTEEKLGRALIVPEDKISEFKKNNPHDIAQMRTEIVKFWLKSQPNEWSTIADAAETLCIKNMAKVIRSEEINIIIRVYVAVTGNKCKFLCF